MYNIIPKMKEHVGISKPKKHTYKQDWHSTSTTKLKQPLPHNPINNTVATCIR